MLEINRQRTRTLDGRSSYANQALHITGIFNAEALQSAPPQTEAYQRKIAEIIELAQNDPTSKFKLKYIKLPEPSEEKKVDETEDNLTLASQKKLPMAIQLIQQQQKDNAKKQRSLTKKERAMLKNEQKRCRLQMELQSVEIGVLLQEMCQQRQQIMIETQSDLDQHLHESELPEWRSLISGNSDQHKIVKNAIQQAFMNKIVQLQKQAPKPVEKKSKVSFWQKIGLAKKEGPQEQLSIFDPTRTQVTDTIASLIDSVKTSQNLQEKFLDTKRTLYRSALNTHELRRMIKEAEQELKDQDLRNIEILNQQKQISEKNEKAIQIKGQELAHAEKVSKKALSDEAQRYEVNLIAFEDCLSQTVHIEQKLAVQIALQKQLQQLESKIEKQNNLEVNQIYALSKTKPLCTSFVHFVGHIMSKRDKSEDVQSFANCLTSLLQEILLQADVFEFQANQLRVTSVQRPLSSKAQGSSAVKRRLPMGRDMQMRSGQNQDENNHDIRLTDQSDEATNITIN